MHPPRIDRSTVLRLAELAQLDLGGPGSGVNDRGANDGAADDAKDGGAGHDAAAVDRVDGLVRDLERIVAFATELADVDVDGVAPMERPEHALHEGALRPDTPGEELDREALLAEAPRVAASGFSVPAFVDEG